MDNITIAEEVLLNPTGLAREQLDQVIADLFQHKIDSTDLYFQHSKSEYWTLEDGIIKDSGFSVEQGVGIRAIVGDKTGFAYTDDLELTSIQHAATAARTIASHGGGVQNSKLQNKSCAHNLYLQNDPLQLLTAEDKINLLRSLDSEARAQDPRVIQVICSLVGSYTTILIAADDGTYAADLRPLVRLNVNVIVEDAKSKREAASHGGGGRGSYQMFLDNNWGLTFAKEAVRRALINLNAKSAPAGVMPVVLGPGWTGVLLHEAVGHGLEGDFNRKKSSAFSGRIGEKIASNLCTVVDNGTIVGRRGSLNIDDEGTKTQCTTLIENGILVNYMQDKLNARLMGMQSTGNGRRESYATLPIPRMTNTYMLPGKHDPAEIINSVDRGIYAVNFGGGQVDITSGKFVFNTTEAYLIEKGKITAPIKGANLIGNGPDILQQISMVGNDLQLDSGVGTCGKDGQSVPVGVGQPTVLLDAITVGGTS